MAHPLRILISRTDNLGDVMLSLPVAGVLKSLFPGCFVGFLGKAYTQPLITACGFIDCFIDVLHLDQEERVWDVIVHLLPRSAVAHWAARRKIPLRIGTSHRVFHWWTCNSLVALGRKNSPWHESRCNLELLRPLGWTPSLAPATWRADYGLCFSTHTSFADIDLWAAGRRRLILHPKSLGSAQEWPLHSFVQLAQLLPANRFAILITGSAADKGAIGQAFDHLPHVKNTAGQWQLSELGQLIQTCDGLVAASTGPLHMAAALGKVALGLYPNGPVHTSPQRWGPLGQKAVTLVSPGAGMASLLPQQVAERVIQLFT